MNETKRMLLTNLTERCSVCISSNSDGFWWRVFTPEYSRNIWCELVVIVGFRETTVCLVRGERGDSMEKRCSKGSKKFSNCPSVCHHFKALSFYCLCYTNKIIALSYFFIYYILHSYKLTTLSHKRLKIIFILLHIIYLLCFLYP